MKPFHLALLTLLGVLLLSACNLPGRQQPTPTDPSALYTAAALTVQAEINQGATSTIAPPPASATPIIFATNTPIQTTPLPPTATLIPPSSTPVPVPCDRGSFVEDVTVPDDTVMAPGATFVKTWRLKNNGSCTWNSSYALVFDSGDSMGGPAASQLTSGSIAPGATIDVSVSLKAPDASGTYRGNWKLRNSAGVVFGIGTNADKPFWVQIKVSPPLPTATATSAVFVAYDLISKGPDAEWRNATQRLSWGDPPDDSLGVAVDLANIKLEDNKTYPRILATYTQRITDGMISGLYPGYTVQDKDHFRAALGFRSDCGSGKVRFQLRFVEAGSETALGEWVETCDGKLNNVDLDLSWLKGRTVQFKLVVLAEGSHNDDKSVWVNPRIER